tara:strand:+ start:108 stop:617 length:510 start_codon:yes stop_codon:yes gene_type:complete
MKTIKQLNNAINSVVNASQKSQDKIQDIVINSFELANNCGNYSPLNLLITLLPNGTRKSDLAMYIIAHSPLQWDKDRSQFKKPKKSGKQYLIEDAIKLKWYDFNQDKPVKDFYYSKRLKNNDIKAVLQSLVDAEIKQQVATQEKGGELIGTDEEKQAYGETLRKILALV